MHRSSAPRAQNIEKDGFDAIFGLPSRFVVQNPMAMNSPFFPCAGSRALHAPTRREFVYGLGTSLGSVALTSLLAAEEKSPLAPKSQMVPAKAKNCIFLMMEGGPSHIDCFDPKPALEKLHLKEFVREGKMKSAMESGKRYYV